LGTNQITTGQVFGLMLLAYAFSFAIRMIWIYQLQDNPSFLWNGQLMINTNDGYFFASGAQKELFGLHTENPRVFGMWDYGVIFFTTLLTKITPFSLETVTLYMPAIISSLVVVPIILIARLYGRSLWGFFAALLGAITWSYYNRTMAGYYDTDMFSAMAPMFILFFLMKSTIDFNLRSALYAAITIAIYPFLYDAGLSVVYAMGIMYALYMTFYHRNDNTTYLSLILIFVALLPFPLASPFSYLAKILVLILLYVILKRSTLDQKRLMLITGVLFVAFLFFGNVLHLVLGKIANYISTGTKESGLHFYSVVQTVREAGEIPFSTFANRISGSQLGVILSLVGYVVLVMRYRAFILALPLVGIGVFALAGGLRFTVYAVPMAALSLIYLFYYIADIEKVKNKLIPFSVILSILFFLEQLFTLVWRYMPNMGNASFVEKVSAFSTAFSRVIKGAISVFGEMFTQGLSAARVEFYDIYIAFTFILLFTLLAYAVKRNKYHIEKWFYIIALTMLFLLPNITHIIGYKVPTVLKKAEVQDLDKLNQLASSKDYTLTWWDYGYPVWYYSDTSTLIDGGKHNNDNFIISKIMQTNSPELAANLSRLAVETYVDSNYSIAADVLFRNGQPDQLDPNLLLSELEDNTYTLPKKTREIYLYMPYRMLNIFPTVMVFGNLDLNTGKTLRDASFYPTNAISSKGGMIRFANGVLFNAQKGEILIRGKQEKVKNFIVTQNTNSSKVILQSQSYHRDGEYVVVYMKSYGRFIVMDVQTFESMYVQMFILGKYDKALFELVVSSPHSKIYKLKK